MNIKLFFSVLLISSICFSQNKSNWNAFKESAHKIGFCIYNVNEEHCKEHEAERKKYELEHDDEYGELFYFLMKEDWAKKRVTDWAEQRKLKLESLVMFFDINQGYGAFVKDSGIDRSLYFYVASLDNDFEFKIKKAYKDKALEFEMFHKEEPNILLNYMWREFMSGRLGLMDNKVVFKSFSKSRIKKHYKKFKKQFFKYQSFYRLSTN